MNAPWWWPSCPRTPSPAATSWTCWPSCAPSASGGPCWPWPGRRGRLPSLADVCVEYDPDGRLGLPAEYAPPVQVIAGQLLALFTSLARGLKPDNPSEAGVIHRVVEGVKVYDPVAFRADGASACWPRAEPGAWAGDITGTLLAELGRAPERQPAVLIAADLNYDYIYECPALEGGSRGADPRPRARELAGAGGIVACGLARLGAEVHLLAELGDDADGLELYEEIARRGVRREGIRRRPGARSAFTLIFADEASGRPRQVATFQGPALEFSVQPARGLAPLLERCALAYSCNYFLLPRLAEAVPELFRQARARGALTAYDANAGDGWDEPARLELLRAGIYPATDLIFLNQDEAAHLTGQADPRRAAAAVRPRQATVVVKCGAAGGGGPASEAGASRSRPSRWPAPIRDTVGAGDSFQAAFLYFLLCGLPVAHCAALASANAACHGAGPGRHRRPAGPPRAGRLPARLPGAEEGSDPGTAGLKRRHGGVRTEGRLAAAAVDRGPGRRGPARCRGRWALAAEGLLAAGASLLQGLLLAQDLGGCPAQPAAGGAPGGGVRGDPQGRQLPGAAGGAGRHHAPHRGGHRGARLLDQALGHGQRADARAVHGRDQPAGRGPVHRRRREHPSPQPHGRQAGPGRGGAGEGLSGGGRPDREPDLRAAAPGAQGPWRPVRLRRAPAAPRPGDDQLLFDPRRPGDPVDRQRRGVREPEAPRRGQDLVPAEGLARAALAAGHDPVHGPHPQPGPAGGLERGAAADDRPHRAARRGAGGQRRRTCCSWPGAGRSCPPRSWSASTSAPCSPRTSPTTSRRPTRRSSGSP